MIFVKEFKAKHIPALLSTVNLKIFLHSASYLDTEKQTRRNAQFCRIKYRAPREWNLLTRTKRNHIDFREAGVLRRISEARKKQVSNIFITKYMYYVCQPKKRRSTG